MTRILLTGATGLLGQAVRRRAAAHGLPLTGLARHGADLACDLADYGRLRDIVEKLRPEVIINAAALVDLPACEADPGTAYIVNSRAVSFLAAESARIGAYLLHISTDHYYSGDGRTLHTETHPVRPPNEYARTKYAGEALALTWSEACIVRTNFVGFRGGRTPTFVEWVIETLKSGRGLSAFTDYYTSSLEVDALADILLQFCLRRPVGIYNVAAGEVFSKEQFILALARRLGLTTDLIRPGLLAEVQSGPKRGDSLGLDVSRVENLLQVKMPDLNQVIENVARHYERSSYD